MITLQYNNDLTYDEWLVKRNDSLGASEVSPVCFGSPYTSNIEIFYQKVTGIKKSIGNLRTYTGHKSENIVDHFYPYYEDNIDNKKANNSIFINAEAGKILRRVENRNVTGRNSKYPHITATPDRFSFPADSAKEKDMWLTEYKNTQSWVLKPHLPGLPLDNVIQLLTQLNVFNIPKGDLFYYIDNLRCELHPMIASKFKSQWQIVLERTIPFWENVLKARVLYNQKYEAQRTFNFKMVDEIDFEIVKLEPPVQYSNGYLNFINENYKSRASLGGKQAAAAEIDKAKRYRDLGKKIDKLEKEKQQMETDLKVAMKDTSILILGKNGEVSWQQYENRKIFKVNYKD